MGSGENSSRSSNNLDMENHESVNVGFDDAREHPDSKIPPLTNSISTGSEFDLAKDEETGTIH